MAYYNAADTVVPEATHEYASHPGVVQKASKELSIKGEGSTFRITHSNLVSMSIRGDRTVTSLLCLMLRGSGARDERNMSSLLQIKVTGTPSLARLPRRGFCAGKDRVHASPRLARMESWSREANFRCVARSETGW